ncbi:exo-alpha-sialidase [Paenibacillus sp. MBLB4367]|uniref:sialidase family protein n=1 Tax=Paenibacillus sp. MBLB4367 TaxID=3384767 RepID=UPI0039081996
MLNMGSYRTEPIALFEPGMIGSAAYRIPSLLTTKKGTVIAGIDVRWDSARDNPNHIAIGIRRSHNGGETWEPIQLLVQYPGLGAEGAAAIDSALLEDAETGTLWMLFSHTPGGIGLWKSQQSIGFDAESRRLLYDEAGEVYFCDACGAVYDRTGARSTFTVEENGDVVRDGAYCGNIYLSETVMPRSLLEARTSFLQVIRSDDDGLSWSAPIELNPQVKKPWMKFIGAGPGRGLQLSGGPNRGRLVFPVYFNNANGRMSNALIYSDDHGLSWQLGESPNDGRLWDGKTIAAESADSEAVQLTESQVVELDNGDIRFYMRNHAGLARTAVAESKDGGLSWGDVTFDDTLVDPICQSTVLAYPNGGDGKARLLWANPAHPAERINGTVRLSEDGGQTWAYAKTVYGGPYWYSCLTVLSGGDIGLLYEGDKGSIYFTKFTLDWIKSE